MMMMRKRERVWARLGLVWSARGYERGRSDREERKKSRGEKEKEGRKMNLMSIDSVVDEGPEEASGVERERDLPVDRTRNGGPAEEGSPVEGET
jgi:hypothetical protein